MYNSESFKRLYDLLGKLREVSGNNYNRTEIIQHFMSEYQQDTHESVNHTNQVLGLLSELGLDELNALALEVLDYPDFIPEGYEAGFASLIQHLNDEVLEDGESCFEEGVPEEYLSNVYTYEQTGDRLVPTTLLDSLMDSFNNSKLKFQNLVNKAIAKECQVDDGYIKSLTRCLNVMEICYRLLNMVTLSDFEEVSEMEHNYDEVTAHIDEELDQVSLGISGLEDYYRNDNAFTNELLTVSGNESYVTGIMSCYSYDPTKVMGTEGFVESIKEGLKKTGELIMNALRAIKDFFFGRKKDALEQMDSLTDDLKKQLEDLQKQDPKTYKINQENIAKLRKMLEDAKMPEIASHFSSINDFTGLLNAYTRAVDDLQKQKSKLADAEKELKDAEAKANEATKEPSGLSEDASAEEKKMVKETQATKAQAAKDAVAKAKAKVTEAFMPVKTLGKLKSLITKLWTKEGESSESGSSEEKKNVTGNESWMF